MAQGCRSVVADVIGHMLHAIRILHVVCGNGGQLSTKLVELLDSRRSRVEVTWNSCCCNRIKRVCRVAVASGHSSGNGIGKHVCRGRVAVASGHSSGNGIGKNVCSAGVA